MQNASFARQKLILYTGVYVSYLGFDGSIVNYTPSFTITDVTSISVHTVHMYPTLLHM